MQFGILFSIFTDCEDVDENCNYWNEQGFCNQTDDFPYLLEVCALSCKACKPCPTQAPTLPPCDEGTCCIMEKHLSSKCLL